MVATGVLPWVSVLAAGMTRNQLAMSMVTISGVVTVILTDRIWSSVASSTVWRAEPVVVTRGTMMRSLSWKKDSS